MINLQETALMGALAFFVREGAVIDGVTVGMNAKPSATPIENWDSLKCILKVQPETESKDYGPKKCFDGKNHTELPVKRSVRDEIMLTTQNMSEYVDELQFGLAAAVVPDGAEVSAFENSDRKIYGWLRIEGRRVGTGDVAKTLELYGYFELETGYDFGDGISEQALKFTHVSGSTLGAPVQFMTAT